MVLKVPARLIQPRGSRAVQERLERMARGRCAAVLLPLFSWAGLVGMGYIPTWKNLAVRRMDVAVAEARRLVPRGDFERRIIAGHPYMLMALGMKLDGPGDLRTLKLRSLIHAPPGTLLIIEQYLWLSGDRPRPEELRRWGYREDLRVSREVDALDPPRAALNLEAEVARVRLWIKGNPPPPAALMPASGPPLSVTSAPPNHPPAPRSPPPPSR